MDRIDPMRVDRVTGLDALPAVVDGWALRGTGPVVVLVGGAAAMDREAGRNAREAIETAILPVVITAGAALVTGGTDAGVMRLAGEARRAAGATFPLVGVVPEGMVDLPDRPAADATPERPATARVQPDHSHLLAVPGDRWGTETPWMFALADTLAGRHPVVTVVLNGGRVARAEIAESVRRRRRVIVVEGTGRAADEIAEAIVDGRPAGEGDPDAALRESGLVQAVRLDEDGALRAALRRALALQHRGSRMSQATTGASGATRPASYEDEMRALIERIDATDEQRQFLRSRWLDQVVYMGDRAADAKRRYYSFRLATVIGGVLVPALVSISLAGAGRFDSDLDLVMRLLTFVVSAVVAITASVEGFFHFGDRWRHYRVNAELLKSEGWQYLTHSGGYRRVTDADQAFQGFAARVEETLRDDVEGFMTQMTSSAPIEKHDIFTKL